MLLAPNDPRVKSLLERQFISYFPSDETMLNERLTAIREQFGGNQFMRAACRTAWDAFRFTLVKKATVVGDFLEQQLSVVSSVKQSPVGPILQGIFAEVEWGTVKENPRQVLDALLRVGVPAAMTAITAVPLAGQLAAGYFALGMKLANIFSKSNALQMPWSEYKRESDEDFVKEFLIDGFAQLVDRTNLFMPPWNRTAPWRLGLAGDPEKPKGAVWAPLVNGQIPWDSGAGAMPGTLRIFGQTQVTKSAGPPSDKLRRYARAPQGFTPRERELPWPPQVTNCGDFYPSAAQAAGVLWNMAEKAGYPDAYTIDVPTLLEAWRIAFETMIESFAEVWSNAGKLMQDVNVAFAAEGHKLLGAAMEPWVAVRLRSGRRVGAWMLGSPFRVPSQHAIITPAVFRGDLPGDPTGRTPSLWIEKDTPRTAAIWPYGAEPEQHPCARWKACDSDLAATIYPDGVMSPAAWRDPNGPAPPGYRKIPWPPPEVDAADYASPYDAIVRPALERLRRQQIAALKTTVVCAYVRPVPVGDRPAYGAFAAQQPGPDGVDLRQICIDMRKQLLASDKRFLVNLDDARAIDPNFADALQASGVTGTWRDRTRAMGVRGPLVDGAAPPPPGEEPQGGVPFGDELVERDGGGGGAVAAGIAAVLGGLWLLR